MTDVDKIEELARYLDNLSQRAAYREELTRYYQGHVVNLRSISTTLTDLQEKAEALEWLFKYAPFTMRDAQSSAMANAKELIPHYLRKRLGKEGT
jgi:hypothetical protein